jgi:16S rRNA (guanine527-N7)-methyltransferase
LKADVVTARAVAPLAELLELAQPFCHAHTICLFPKGQDVVSELTNSSKYWRMNCEMIASRSDSMASILRIRTITNDVESVRAG